MANDVGKRASILDVYRDEIEKYIEIGVSLRSVWKIIKEKLPEGVTVSYPGFYRYCKRRGIMQRRDGNEDNY